QPSHLAGHIALFRIAGGMLYGPIAFDVSARALKPEVKAAGNGPTDGAPAASARHSAPTQSMEARILERLRAVEVAAPRSAQEWMEHLAILKRWYYRTNKVGEIFFEDEQGGYASAA